MIVASSFIYIYIYIYIFFFYEEIDKAVLHDCGIFIYAAPTSDCLPIKFLDPEC